MLRSNRLDARTAAVLALVAALSAPLAPNRAAAATESAELDAKETLKLEARRPAQRRSKVSLRLAGDSFLLFGEGRVGGVIVPGKGARDSWQLDFEGVQALEAHLTDWVRGGGTTLDPSATDAADVEIVDLEVRARRTPNRARTTLSAKARVVVSIGQSESVEGVYRLRGRGTLGEPAAPEGVLEEGWVPGPYGPIRASYRILGDRAVVAGDTMVPLDELRELQAQVASGALAPFIGAPVVVPQAAITKKGWPEGRIPYEIADGFEETQLEAIHRAIEHWNERTVIRLAPRSGESTYLRFVQTDKPHCYGYLGYGSGVREIQLSSGCGRGAIIHEIGHVVGLSHEQQRDDRDTYVFFDEDAVDPDYAYAFDYKGRVFGPYNYRSIMHYPPYAFAIPGEGPTLTALRDLPLSETIMGQHSELSKGDVAAAKYLTTGDPRTFFNAYSEVWSEYFAADAYQYGVGDVSGNGAPDLVAFGGTGGSVFVARGGPGLDGFVPGERWVTGFCGVELHCLVGDVNGDGRADVVEGETGRVAFSNGSRFVHAAGPVGGIGEFDRFFLVDVNADCRADLVAVVGGGNLPAEVYVALSTGSGFAPKLWWGDFQAGGYAVGDVDADGRADFVARRGAQILVSLSHGEGFEAAEPWWQPASWFPGGAFEVADVNGDRRADLVSLSPLSPEYAGRVAIALSTGRDFRGDVVNYHELDCLNEAGCLIADVDGDDLADLVDPVSTRRGQSHAARLAGDVFVSRSTSFVTDSIGPLKPVLGDVVFGGRCSRPSPPAQR